MKLRCRAFDSAGKAVVETVDAQDAAAATEILRRRGLFVAEVTEESAAAMARSSGASSSNRHVGSRARLNALTGFSRQMAVLLSTGTPILDALVSLERQTPAGHWKDSLSDIRARIEQGHSLSESLAQHPEYFDAVSRSLIAAGESGGQLPVMLDRLAKLTRQQQRVNASVMGAMAYPVLLIGVSLVVLSLMIGFVLPRFEQLFKSLNAPLPPTTRFMLAFGGFMAQWWWAVFAGAVALVTSAVFYTRSRAGRTALDNAVVRLPIFGTLIRGLLTARLARVLGVLLEGRVPLLDALGLTRLSMGNAAYSTMIARAEDAATRGESISPGLADFKSGGAALIGPATGESIRSGERTGKLGPVLLNIADALDEDNEIVVRSLTSIIEPIILLVLGLVVGVVALSMFVPLFDLTSASGHGGAH
ncbi:MAG: type II secretion system F family protein [Phycisphaerales bacterium]|nr:type II secretion system F family protein [Phycisphaerales bacterium]